MNEEGSPDTSWWNNNGSVPGYIDFTNPEAATWYSDRVRNVIETYDIDSVKFDAGESSWSPQVLEPVTIDNETVAKHYQYNITFSYSKRLKGL